MHNKLVELILIKESNIKCLKADSRIKSKLRSYGNGLANDAIEFLQTKLENDVKSFPEANPEPVKYFHSYITDFNKYTTNNNLYANEFVDDLKKRFKLDPNDYNEPELYNISKVLLTVINDLNNEEIDEYNSKFKSLINYSESSSVYRIYVVTPDIIPDLSKKSRVSDLFINELFNHVLTDAILRIDSENSDDINICVLVDEDLSKIEKYNEELTDEDLDFRPGFIKNTDGSIRGFYTENRCKYIQ